MFFLLLLFLEFLFNRTLNRFWIFVPHNPATYVTFLTIQWVGVIPMLAIYIASFLIVGSWGRRYLPLGVAMAILTSLDLTWYYLGWRVRLLFALPLISSVVFRDALVFSVYYLIVGFADVYLGGVGKMSPYFELAWALLPLAGGWRFNKWAVATAVVVFAIVSVPHMGLVVNLSLGLKWIYLLPLAVYLALSSKSKYPPLRSFGRAAVVYTLFSSRSGGWAADF